MDSLTKHFQLTKIIPQARQIFLITTRKPGEQIDNFVTPLQTRLAQQCDYNDEKDNQMVQIHDCTLTIHFVTGK